MEVIFHSHANKTHFHKNGCAPSLILKVTVFGTRKWPFHSLLFKYEIMYIKEFAFKSAKTNYSRTDKKERKDHLKILPNCLLTPSLIQFFLPKEKG